MKKVLVVFLALFGLIGALYAQFTIKPDGKMCQIYQNGNILIAGMKTALDFKDFKYDCETKALRNGMTVHNVWSTDKSFPFRLEIAVPANGEYVEISAQTERAAFEPAPYPPTLLSLTLSPEQIKNAKYEGYVGTGRSATLRKGVFDDAFKQNTNWRFLALESPLGRTVFDFNPGGVGDWCLHYEAGVMRGVAKVEKNKNALVCHWPNNMAPFGGTVTLKLRIYQGGMETFNANHARIQMQYWDAIPADRRYAFASKMHGQQFASIGDEEYSDSRREGWLEASELRKTVTTPGVLYSHVNGRDATFRMSGLRGGLHLITFGAGNPKNTPNDFSISVNGEKMISKQTIGAGRMLVATLPIWIENGIADVRFDGVFIVSMLTDQLLMALSEDFSCRRGFWVSEGVMPGIMFRNENYLPYACHFKPSLHEAALPVPGQESKAPFHASAFQIPKMPAKNTEWLSHLKFEKIGTNESNLNELSEQKRLEEYFDKLKAEGRTCLMLSGLHSRHTFPDGERRSVPYIRKICEAAHVRGMKVIEHHDATLLWNMDAGFRTLAERIDEVGLDPADNLPNMQFCIMNPRFQEKLKAYLVELAKAGVDGFQLDETSFPLHGGSCSHCRKVFEEDTGWKLPANECDNWYQDFSLPVTKAWFNWKVERSRIFSLQLKAELAKINPNVIFSKYGVLSSQMTSNGLRAWNSNFLDTMDSFDLIGHECQATNTIANSRMFVTGQKFFNTINTLSNASVFTWLYCNDGNSAYFGYAVNNMNAQSALFFREGTIGKAAVGGDYLAFNASPDNMNRQLARPMRNVAILVPGQTRDWDASISMPESPFGIAQALEELHIPYQMLGERSLTNQILAQFRVLFVGSASALSKEQLTAIIDFAKNGGTVMLDTTAATRNQLGVRHKTWPLANIFGVNQPGRIGRASGKAILLTKNGEVPLSGTSLYYATEFEPELPVRRSPFQIKLENGKKLPGMISKKVGKGIMIYLPMRFGEIAYVPDLKPGSLCPFVERTAQIDFFRNLLRGIVGENRLLDTDAPQKVYMTVYKEGECILVHILNGTGTGARHAEKITERNTGNPFPPLGKDIHLSLHAPNAKKAFAVSPDFNGRRPLQMQIDKKGKASVTLPKELLKVYLIVRIQL